MAFSWSISLQLPLSSHFLHPQSLPSTASFHSRKFKVYQEEIKRSGFDFLLSYRLRSSQDFFEHDDDGSEDCSFDEAVFLFNSRDYYKCHEFLESLWNKAQEPRRTLIHGILQCAVGFHHLFNQNHHGAMMELGEGLCKLRKMNFQGGPFHHSNKRFLQLWILFIRLNWNSLLVLRIFASQWTGQSDRTNYLVVLLLGSTYTVWKGSLMTFCI